VPNHRFQFHLPLHPSAWIDPAPRLEAERHHAKSDDGTCSLQTDILISMVLVTQDNLKLTLLPLVKPSRHVVCSAYLVVGDCIRL
jgi:hypothetical protein